MGGWGGVEESEMRANKMLNTAITVVFQENVGQNKIQNSSNFLSDSFKSKFGS